MSSLLLRQHLSTYSADSPRAFNEKAQADILEAFIGKPELFAPLEFTLFCGGLNVVCEPI
jgi:hypothetical protein